MFDQVTIEQALKRYLTEKYESDVTLYRDLESISSEWAKKQDSTFYLKSTIKEELAELIKSELPGKLWSHIHDRENDSLKMAVISCLDEEKDSKVSQKPIFGALAVGAYLLPPAGLSLSAIYLWK
jgi:hypothetical protein